MPSRPGRIIGKSAILKLGATAGPLGTTYLSTGGGTLVTADGASAPTASAVKGTEKHTNGLTDVALYRVGSYGSALSRLRSKFFCSMEGLYQPKAAPKLKDVKPFKEPDM